MGYVAFVLDEQSRAKLLKTYPPQYPDVIAHHVTLKFGLSEAMAAEVIVQYFELRHVEVVGYANGGNIEAVVVKVNGHTARRDEQSWFHVTLSLDRSQGVKPKDSNTLLNTKGWKPSIPLILTGRVEYRHY